MQMDETPARAPRLPQPLQIGLLIFILAGGAAAVFVPQLADRLLDTFEPNFVQLLATGAILIVLTGVLLSYASRALGLSKAWWVMALLYNSLVIVAKFILAPASLYDQTFEAGFYVLDPNNAGVYAAVAVGVAAIYGLAAFLIYRVYRQKVKSALPSDPTPPETPAAHRRRLIIAVLLAAVLLGAGYASGLLMGRPLIVSIGTLQYLQYAFSGVGLLIILSSVAAIFAGMRAFAIAADTAISARNPTLLSTFFWFGLYLILIYHALWVVYMTTLISLWPF
jgi:hypothetical protein